MAVRDLNVFEKHAEKLVLGAAAAGAVFMGYLAFQKVTIEGDIGPNDVETSIQKAVFGDASAGFSVEHPAPGTLEYSRQEIEKLGQPRVQVRNYVKDYESMSQLRPLDPALTAATAVPTIGPANYSPSRIREPENPTMALKLPDPVGPEMLHFEATQLLVHTDPIPAGFQLQPGMALSTTDQKVVVIDGYIPVGRMLKQMLAEKDMKSRIPNDRMRVVIQNIKVLRSEVLPNGGQSAFVPVPPTKAIVPPVEPIAWGAASSDDVVPNMEIMDRQFKQVVIPDFFPDSQGVAIAPPILMRPIPEKVANEISDLHVTIEAMRVGAISTPGRGPATPGVTPPGAAAPTALFPADPSSVKVLEVVPFTFWDQTVEAGHRYRYQVSVEFVNPAFGWPFGLQNAADKLKPALAAAPITSDIITIHSDIEFFILSGMDTNNETATARVFKRAGNGRWYHNDFSARAGLHITGSIRTDDGSMAVDTDYTVVDVQKIGTTSEVHVVLKDPVGNLVTRDSSSDSRSPDMDRLMNESKKPAATNPAATLPTAVVPPVPTVTPTRGGTTTPPTPPPTPPTTNRIPLGPRGRSPN